MIRVTVELDRLGLGKSVVKLAEMHIINDGSGTSTRGNYVARTLRKGSKDGAVTREARIESWPRQAWHVWRLVARALQELDYS